jgi:hypothetical protein
VSRRRLIHLVLVVAFALAHVLSAAAGDRAGHAHARTAAPTIAVAMASIPHAVAPRLKDGGQAWAPRHALADEALSTARLAPSGTSCEPGVRVSRLEFLRRPPAGCRPPPQR